MWAKPVRTRSISSAIVPAAAPSGFARGVASRRPRTSPPAFSLSPDRALGLTRRVDRDPVMSPRLPSIRYRTIRRQRLRPEPATVQARGPEDNRSESTRGGKRGLGLSVLLEHPRRLALEGR